MSTPRALAFAATAVLALAACSSDSGDDEPEVTTPDTADVEIEVTIPDVSLDVTIPDLSLDITIPDVSIPDFDDITIPDITLPDISVTEEAEDVAREVLGNTGLDDDQIDCLVERAQETGEQLTSPDDVLGLLEDCDIELTDLAPGG